MVFKLRYYVNPDPDPEARSLEYNGVNLAESPAK